MCAIIAAAVLFLWSLPLAGWAAAAGTIVIRESSAQKTVYATVGDKLKVILKGNPTTGYIWEKVKGRESILQQEGNYQYKPESGLVGAGGTFVFSFRLKAAGTKKLRLIYHRPFEKNVQPLKILEVTVIVRR